MIEEPNELLLEPRSHGYTLAPASSTKKKSARSCG
jgi:hypothetical protein